MKIETMRTKKYVENEFRTLTLDQLGVFLIGGHNIHLYSRSPVMWNAVFERFNIPAVYQALSITSPKNVLLTLDDLFQEPNFRGSNVGSPWKNLFYQRIKKGGTIDISAEKTESVNTVVTKNDHLIGYSTDGRGEIANLRQVIDDFSGISVLMLGAGGGARAVSAALLDEGIKHITISNRTNYNAEKLASELIEKDVSYRERITTVKENQTPELLKTGEFGLVLNASLKGQKDKDTEGFSSLAPANPLDHESRRQNLETSRNALKKFAQLNPNAVCADLIYNPLESPFLEHAREVGLKTNNGMMMLVHQAVIAFQIIFPEYNRISYDDLVNTMKDAFEKASKK